MNFIYEEDVTFLQVGKECRDVAGFFDRRSGCRSEFRFHLVSDDIREGRLAQSGRAGQENMVESFVTAECSFHVHAQIFFDLLLADVVGKTCWPHSQLKLTIRVSRGFVSNSHRLFFRHGSITAFVQTA